MTSPSPLHLDAGDAEPPDDPRRRRLALAVVALLGIVGLAVAAWLEQDTSGPPSGPDGGWTLVPHEGLGAWVDVYDWTEALTDGNPPVGLEDIDAMASLGVQTLYLQTAHARIPGEVAEPERLLALVDRAHEQGMHVVAWYLPTLQDVDEDLDRLRAAAELRVDGLAVDIESIEVADPVERTARLVDLSRRLRTAVGPEKAIAAVTLTPIHLDVLNREYWPGYPWDELARDYDAILPMAYWSVRRGELRSGSRYVGENLDRLRDHVGDSVPIHVIGGIADGVTPEDLAGMVAAVDEYGAIGGSLYDWNTATPGLWDALADLRALRTEPDD